MALLAKHRASIYTKLSPVIGDEETEALLAQFPSRDDEEPITKLYLRSELHKLEGCLRTDMSKLEGSLRTEMAQLAGDVRGEMKDMRTELKGDVAALRTTVKSWFIRLAICIVSTGIAAASAAAGIVSFFR